LQANRCDWTLWWRRLCGYNETQPDTARPLLDLCIDRDTAQAWLDRYSGALKLQSDRFNGLEKQSLIASRQQAMKAINPKFVLRNYLAQNAIAAAEKGDYREVNQLAQVLAKPFDEQPEFEHYAALPPDWAQGIEVSCSS
jgi:serine/tyrosine/threonine adenylyltransferase